MNQMKMNNNKVDQMYDNMPKNNMMMDNFNAGFSSHNPEIQINAQNIKSILRNKIYISFLEMNPKYNPNDPENKRMKKLWEEEFLSTYNRIYKMKNETNKKDDRKKLIINFYDICKREIYFDFDLKIRYLNAIIISKLGYDLKKIIKRIKRNQTTKYLIENPLIEIIDNNNFDIYEDSFYFEYEGKNLCSLEYMTAYDIGLKEGNQIQLKINYNYIKRIPESKTIITLIFNFQGKVFTIQRASNSTLYSTFKECRRYLDFKEEDLKFYMNYKELIPCYKTLSQLGIRNRTNIDVILGGCVIGAGGGCPPLDFVDVSTGKIKTLEFSEDAPKWRIVKEGLNIFGICNYSKCKAYKKEVVYPTELKESLIFVLNEEIINIKCPICSKIIKPKTCGFWKCEYQFIGKKIEEGDLIEFDSKTKETNSDDFEYYNPFENGETQWVELTIYVLPKQSITYKLH